MTFRDQYYQHAVIHNPPREPGRRSQDFWDRYFLSVAQAVAVASKDPSTKVGAVVVRPDRTMASFGYNGFPRGVHDTDERLNDRPTKYAMVVHGEANALLTAREPLHGYTLYCTLFPCSDCAKLIIQTGIVRVVSWHHDIERWRTSFELSCTMFDEAGVFWTMLENTDVKENHGTYWPQSDCSR